MVRSIDFFLRFVSSFVLVMFALYHFQGFVPVDHALEKVLILSAIYPAYELIREIWG